jgi:hypothetical protein
MKIKDNPLKLKITEKMVKIIYNIRSPPSPYLKKDRNQYNKILPIKNQLKKI